MSLAGVYANKELTGEVAKSFAKTWRKIQAENLDGFKTDLISPLRIAIVPQGNPFTFTALAMTAKGKAVNRKTQQKHLLLSNQREKLFGREIEGTLFAD